MQLDLQLTAGEGGGGDPEEAGQREMQAHDLARDLDLAVVQERRLPVARVIDLGQPATVGADAEQEAKSFDLATPDQFQIQPATRTEGAQVELAEQRQQALDALGECLAHLRRTDDAGGRVQGAVQVGQRDRLAVPLGAGHAFELLPFQR